MGVAPWAYLQAPLPQYWTRFDVGANLVGYAPLGFLLALALMRMRSGWPAVTLATLAAACLSLVLEALQTYLPLRVASNVDFGLNAAGGLAGAVAAWVLERVGAIDRWRRLRARWFVRNSRGALVLLALWPLGLLFPATTTVLGERMIVVNLALPITPAKGDEWEEQVRRWNLVQFKLPPR